MSILFNLIAKGGPVMIPLTGLSVATIACGIERTIFWVQVLRVEDKIAHDVLDAAQYSLDEATAIALRAADWSFSARSTAT